MKYITLPQQIVDRALEALDFYAEVESKEYKAAFKVAEEEKCINGFPKPPFLAKKSRRGIRAYLEPYKQSYYQEKNAHQVLKDIGIGSKYENYEEYLKVSAAVEKEYLKVSAADEIDEAKRSSRMRQIHLESKKLAAVKKEFKERDKEKRMKERAERKKEKDKDIIITEY
jgi:vacuolar-type H+-ATPase catalytic subunit A/Vma1